MFSFLSAPQNYCQNYVVNALLKIYTTKAQRNDVKLSIFAAIPNTLAINQSDLCCVIANALENAGEAAVKCEHGFINFKAEIFQNVLKIELENSCAINTVFHEGLPLSTKKGSEGTGTKSICAIAEKYNGMAKFDQQNQVFHTRILLKLPA